MARTKGSDKDGRGEFFAIDRRVWPLVCKLGLNAALAYLVLAHGSLADNRTTSWSCEALRKRLRLRWGGAESLVATLVGAGLVREDKGGSKPRRFLLPAHEVPGSEAFPPRPIENATAHQLLDRLHRRPDKTLPFPTTHMDSLAATLLVERGHAVRSGNVLKARDYDGDAAEEPAWIWLPKTLLDGVASEDPPFKLLQKHRSLPILQLFVSLYGEQKFDYYGGLPWSKIRLNFERVPVGEKGQHIVWGFKKQRYFVSCPLLTTPFMTGRLETVEIDGTKHERDAGWSAFWDAFFALLRFGLVEAVPHILEAVDDDAQALFPYATGNAGEPGERAVAASAQKAAIAMLTDRQVEWAAEQRLLMAPVKWHIPQVAMVGLVRLRYRARTKLTALWLAEQDWAAWEQDLNALGATASHPAGGDPSFRLH